MFYIVNFVEVCVIYSLNLELDFSYLFVKDIILLFFCLKLRMYMNYVLKKWRVMDDL